MISVIIPTYNRGAFVELAVGSVLAQTFPCSEVLLVDDGSSDDTAALVRRLAKESRVPVRYIFQHNQGASAARNRGINEAQGEILCFLDSDDRWAANKLELQFAAMQQCPHYLISHTREIWYRQGRLVNQKKKHAPGNGDIFERSLGMCVVGMSTVMIRRELFVRYGVFDEDLPCCEDYDLWLRVGCREKFLLVDEPLTLKDGGRPDQLSTIHRRGMDSWRIKSLCNLLDSGRLSTDHYRLALAELTRKCTIYGNGCIKHGRVDEGSQYLNLAERYIDQGR